jgi:hypothetical protein
MSILQRRYIRIAASAVAFFLVTLGGARDAAAQDFYKGKTISIILSGGGTFESWARLLAKYMPKYIPGGPNMIVKSMTGAAGLRAANYMYNLAPKDGTEIAGVHGQVPTLPLFNRQGVQYEPTRFAWLGSVTSGLYVAYAWHTSSVQSLEEALLREMIVGGQSVGSIPVDVPVLANNLLGTKLKIVTGYQGAPEAKLAVERGEINGEFGTLLTTLRSSNGDWFRDKKIKIIAQFGATRRKDLPDVPVLSEFAKNADDRAALDLYLSRQATDKPYLAPPGTPPDRLAILRKAFDQAVYDPEFRAEAARLELVVDGPMTGQELAAFIDKAFQTPPSAAQRVSDILNSFAN